MTKLTIPGYNRSSHGSLRPAEPGESIAYIEYLHVDTENLELLGLGEHNDLQTVVDAITKMLAISPEPAAPRASPTSASVVAGDASASHGIVGKRYGLWRRLRISQERS